MMLSLRDVQITGRTYEPTYNLLHQFAARSVSNEMPGFWQGSYTLDASLVEVAKATHKAIRAEMPAGWATEVYAPDAMEFVIAAGKDDKPSLLAVIARSKGRSNDQRVASRSSFNITIRGDATPAYAVGDVLQALYGDQHLPEVKWVYMDGEDVNNASIILDPPDHVSDVFYPFIDGGVNAYLDGYLNDRASILFLSGTPGTGKTTLIRHMLHRHGLRAMISYEEALLGADSMFVQFLLSTDENVLVIEDADTMLASRPGDEKKRIARFLNVSDGIIKLTEKKIIFTTNMPSFKDVDEALLRPGRCYGALTFRALTFAEAKLAARAAGVLEPKVDRHYTLADVFNQKAIPAVNDRKVGF